MDRLKEMKDTFFRELEKFCYPSVCVQCHNRIAGGYVTKAHGYELIFCSMECGHAYWNDYSRYKTDPMTHQQGPRICRLPGCNKPCYQEGSKVHDYCGRTHAQEHGAMTSSQGGKGGRSTGYHRQNSGGHTNTNYNQSSFSSGYYSGWSQSGPIKFYNRGEPYYEFTNFYEAVVTIDGEDWLTTEHYFQAQKFVGTPLVGTIRMLERPREAFDKSRDPRYSSWRRSDWETVKEDVMYKALQAKFTQHKVLGRQLRETGCRELIEHSPHDSYWGDGGDGSGKNRLGALLMKLREEMKPRKPVTAPSPPSPMHTQPLLSTSSLPQHVQRDGSAWSKSPSPKSSPGSRHSDELAGHTQPLLSTSSLPQHVQRDGSAWSKSPSPKSSPGSRHSDELAGQPSTDNPNCSGRSQNSTTSLPKTENPPPRSSVHGSQRPIVQPSDVVASPVATQTSTTTTQQYKVTVTFSSSVVTSPSVFTQSGSQHPTTVCSTQQGTSTCSSTVTSPSTSQYPSSAHHGSQMNNLTGAALQSTATSTNLMGNYEMTPETSGSQNIDMLMRNPLHPISSYHPPASYASVTAHGAQLPPVHTQPNPTAASAGPPDHTEPEPMDTTG